MYYESYKSKFIIKIFNLKDALKKQQYSDTRNTAIIFSRRDSKYKLIKSAIYYHRLFLSFQLPTVYYMKDFHMKSLSVFSEKQVDPF